MTVPETQPYRMPTGGTIDRSQLIDFTFDDQKLTGYRGDTLASALLANGIRLVGRSFKYHRPRGVLTAGSDEPNALVELRTGNRREPNTRATTIELFPGLQAKSQNRWPSLRFDVSAIHQLFAPFIGAGFYYKTFMWPKGFWEKLYEPLIRRSAGLGSLSKENDPDAYEKAYAFCDVLVIGGGPAGLMAALAAGRAGARVILCDEDFAFGGRLLSTRLDIDGAPAQQWLQQIVQELMSLPEVRLMPRTTVFGAYDGSTYGALERVSDHLAATDPWVPRQRLWNICAKRIVLASGALERMIAFGGNDRPGVMLASAVRSYLNRYGVSPGEATAVFTNNDDGWKTARDLTAAGCTVAAIIDSRPAVDLELRSGIDPACEIILDGHVIATRGRTALSSIVVEHADSPRRVIEADALAVSGGWNPALGLTCHLGNRPVWNERIASFVPGEFLPPGMTIAGAVSGHFSLQQILVQGAEAGRTAAEQLGLPPAAIAVPTTEDRQPIIQPLWHVESSQGPAFVDFQNDVTIKDINAASEEGFRSVEHLKRYTTLGMATDQGKGANVNAVAILADATGRTIPGTGTTTFRPPYTPVSIAAFAGRSRGKEFRPTRRAPSHTWATEQGATFVETGLWLRAQWFARPGERDWRETVAREVNGVRNNVGVCDVSTLGKIDIQGPDAAAFLDRIYINTFSNLAVGRVRYGAMLREDGFVMDDGTTTRLSETHFYMTTTTANAAKVMEHLEFCHQVLWPALDVRMVSVTEQWAQYAVAGPRSRELLRTIVDKAFDISNDAFPYMAAMELTVCGGIPARLFRVSFSGEHAYEVAVPCRYGDALMRVLMQNGATMGAVPYGTEALGIMRIEKGHPAGNELNGQTTAKDLGLGKMMSTRKDFIGRVMAQRPALLAVDRPALAGFRPVDSSARLTGGAHFLPLDATASAENDQGFMSSVAFSPTLGHAIGLGFIRGGVDRIGERVRAYDPVRNLDTEVEVCPPVFWDPKGERLRA